MEREDFVCLCKRAQLCGHVCVQGRTAGTSLYCWTESSSHHYSLRCSGGGRGWWGSSAKTHLLFGSFSIFEESTRTSTAASETTHDVMILLVKVQKPAVTGSLNLLRQILTTQ